MKIAPLANRQCNDLLLLQDIVGCSIDQARGAALQYLDKVTLGLIATV